MGNIEITISLPEDVVREARALGMLSDDHIAALLRYEIERELNQVKDEFTKLDDLDLAAKKAQLVADLRESIRDAVEGRTVSLDEMWAIVESEDNTIISDANLSDADLWYDNLQNAHLVSSNFNRAKLWYASLSGANLNNAKLLRASLRYADLSGTNLFKTDFSEEDLESANLSKANLRYANLCGANLREANLCGADLGDSNMENANLYDAKFDADTILPNNKKFTEQTNWLSFGAIETHLWIPPED